MKPSQIADVLWGNKSKWSYLLLASVLLLLAFLGGREIWTQEHRWADIVAGMFYRHDFLHPYLGENSYYDKPLLSYWLIAILAKITGQLTTWSLRFPSALAGLLAIWSIYRLGCSLKDKSLGMLAGWLLLTTFYFVFWARTSSADMLNLAGTFFAIAWYMDHKKSANFFSYSVFFLILAVTALCKGLVGVVVPMIAIATDLCLQKSWRTHLRLPLLLAILPALFIYILPFIASSYFGGHSYGENGLYLVYRENILRYFQPFDHQGPIYTYLIYLPIYLLPWAIFFLPALWTLPKRWQSFSQESKWIAWTLLLVFLFFTLSGSRRSYYVLPIVPFAILFTADWILSSAINARRLSALLVTTFVALFLVLDVIPAWYYSHYGVNRFAMVLQQKAAQIKPWNNWHIVLLDAESKLNFYLHLPPDTRKYQIQGTFRKQETAQALLKTWPILLNKPADTIFISRKLYVPMLQPFFHGYQLVELSNKQLPFMKSHDVNAPIAFIPAK